MAGGAAADGGVARERKKEETLILRLKEGLNALSRLRRGREQWHAWRHAAVKCPYPVHTLSIPWVFGLVSQLLYSLALNSFLTSAQCGRVWARVWGAIGGGFRANQSSRKEKS